MIDNKPIKDTYIHFALVTTYHGYGGHTILYRVFFVPSIKSPYYQSELAQTLNFM